MKHGLQFQLSPINLLAPNFVFLKENFQAG